MCRSRQGRDGRYIAVAKEEQKAGDAGVVDVAGLLLLVVVVVVHAERARGKGEKKKET